MYEGGILIQHENLLRIYSRVGFQVFKLKMLIGQLIYFPLLRILIEFKYIHVDIPPSMSL